MQEDRRKHSAMLLLCFLGVMLAMALVIHVVSIFISVPGTDAATFLQPSTPAKAFIVLIWVMCGVGCFFRYQDVKEGGAALARRFGAVEAQVGGRNKEESLLVDIVSEIAIASNCSKPQVFVLPGERSINAFVVGGFDGDEAIVVSSGAIYNLDRDQLSAIVAHEFGHISQKDIPINMRLLIALGGLNAIDEIGKLLMVRVDGELVMQPGLVVGFVIRCIGSIGVFFGSLIRSAFSREREFLADACAVQFTRNPKSVASVLTAIRDQPEDIPLHIVHAEEVAHLCIYSEEKTKWYDKYFATHPTIQDRIDAIDPQHALKIFAEKRKKKKQLEKRERSMYTDEAGATVIPFAQGESVGAALSDQATIMMSDPMACIAILHALFVGKDLAKRQPFLSTIEESYNKKFSTRVSSVLETLDEDLNTKQIKLIEQAAESLCVALNDENRKRLLNNLHKMLLVDGEASLANYTTLQLISRKLGTKFYHLDSVEMKQSTQSSKSVESNEEAGESNKDVGESNKEAGEQPVDESSAENNSPKKATAKSFKIMGNDFALLLSLIVEASGNEQNNLDEQFESALKCYTQDHYPRRSASEPGIVSDLESSFKLLYVQPQSVREAFVRHCLELAQSDGHIAEDERALLNLFAASLNCQPLAA